MLLRGTIGRRKMRPQDSPIRPADMNNSAGGEGDTGKKKVCVDLFWVLLLQGVEILFFEPRSDR